MLKKSLSLFALGLLISSSLFSEIDTTKVLKADPQADLVKEGLIIPVSDSELQQKWTLAYTQIVPDGSWILEWIPKGEDVNAWSELIQVQFFPTDAFQSQIPSAVAFADLFLQSLKQKFPEVTSKTERSDDNNVFIEWTLPNPSLGEKAQNELVQLIMTKAGIYRVAFTKKVPDIASDVKAKWKEILSKIKVNEIAAQEPAKA